MSSRKRKMGVAINKYASAVILLNDTVSILRSSKSRIKRELLSLSKLFKKSSIILVGGFCRNNR